MVVRGIVLVRHGERIDRYLESIGQDWISTAPRPQDPILSEGGSKDAYRVGTLLKGIGATRILCSPFIRTVQTAHYIAEALGLGENSVHVEYGLIEECKSFRGKNPNDGPLPSWDPLVLPLEELAKYSPYINLNYKSLHHVEHVKDETRLNHVREVSLDPNLVEINDITNLRCKVSLSKIINNKDFENEIIICVGHGATVKGYSKALEANLSDDLKIPTKHPVSFYAHFIPLDANNPEGPWYSPVGSYGSGAVEGNERKEGEGDTGF